uniref:Cytochrome c oxidase subunit 2 n=1 Tax=Polydora hoplura TaxID=1495204 RepID=A0A8F9S283_9ANNE|nr:cytochrome c oxidase subunit II [Polydora hoplura]QYL01503.1 cytochrome oxidase subunit 2 [Polydora hoplura]
MPEWAQCGFQDPASDIMMGMVEFHDYVMSNMTVVVFIVTSAYICLFKAKRTFRYFVENQHLETLWTILPAVMLVSLAIPSLRLLYLQDETWKPEFTLKVEGHQWYWEYEIPNLLKSVDYPIPITSTYSLPMSSEQTPKMGVTHLLEVTNRAILPTNSVIQILVSSADVLHSFTVPSLGMKVDAVPGRSNAWSVNIKRPGIYAGQCSEICGVNHAFMPIVIEAVPYKTLLTWLKEII